MLLKLIKRDLTSVKIMYLALIAIIPNALMFRFSEFLPDFVTALLGITMFFLASVITMGTGFSVMYSYFDDFVGKRAYFYHTIPEKLEIKLLSKLIYAYIIGLIAFIVLILTALLMFSIDFKEVFEFFFSSFAFIFEAMKENPIATFNFTLFILIAPAISLHRYFLAMTLSQFRSLTKNRIVDSIIWYIFLGIGLRFLTYITVEFNLMELISRMNMTAISFVLLILTAVWFGCLFYANLYLLKKKIQVQ